MFLIKIVQELFQRASYICSLEKDWIPMSEVLGEMTNWLNNELKLREKKADVREDILYEQSRNRGY